MTYCAQMTMESVQSATSCTNI